MSVLYIVISIIYFVAGFSETKTVSPSCVKEYYDSVKCSGIDNPDDLIKAFQQFTKGVSTTETTTVTILDSDFSYIPHDLFQDHVMIQFIRIRSTTLISLSDTDTAFEGLESSLKFFHLENSTFLSDFDWYQLRNLKSLIHLELDNIGLEYVDSDVSALYNLKRLYLQNSEISYIDEEAFAKLVHLWNIGLKGNKISEMKRSMFPNPAKDLETISLSENKISSLPSDFFINMPNLKGVYLDSNSLQTLDQASFAPIWKANMKINLLSNPLRCDCRMKWLLNEPSIKADAKCAEPIQLRERDIKTLTRLELWCF